MSSRPGLSWYDRSSDVTWESRTERARASRPTSPWMPVIACSGCWCGEPFGHDWPGKADGAPHPR